MKGLFIATVCLGALCCTYGRADESLPGIQLKFGAPREYALKLVVTQNNQPLATAFDAYLVSVLAHFDRDGDGVWNQAEVARVFAFPTGSGKTASLKLGDADGNSDGRVQLGELQAWCATHGIGPLIEVATSLAESDAHLAKIFSAVLDPDRDGLISKAELQYAGRRLQRFDLDDNEILDLKELLARTNVASEVKFVDDSTIVPGRLAMQINFGDKPSTSLLRSSDAYQLTLTGNRFHLHGGSKAHLITGKPQREMPAMETLAEFLVAQLEEAVAGENGLRRSVFSGNESLRGLQDLYPFADQDGNEELTVAELRSYLKLLTAGLLCQDAVKLHDRGWNLFPYLDIDCDLRLTPIELARIRDLPVNAKGQPPHWWELEFGTLPVTTWGGVHLPAPAKMKAKPATKLNMPGWFQAQDRNGDSVISMREFLGPVSRFAELDANGDDLLDLTEAAGQAEK